MIDHVTSQTALVMLVAELVGELERRGVDVLVDGAHVPGMVELDVGALAPACYAANGHTWLCAPKGAGFLWVREDRRSMSGTGIVMLPSKRQALTSILGAGRPSSPCSGGSSRSESSSAARRPDGARGDPVTGQARARVQSRRFHGRVRAVGSGFTLTTRNVEVGRPNSGMLPASLLVSALAHLAGAQWISGFAAVPPSVGSSFSALTVEVVSRAGPAAPASPADSFAPPLRAAEPPPAASRTVRVSVPERSSRETHVDGVRLATAADVRTRRERRPDPPARAVARTHAGARRERPEAEPMLAAVARPPTRRRPSSLPGRSPAVRVAGRATKPSIGPFRLDSPHYSGRMFGQISVRGSHPGAFYGRIHLFPEHDRIRDYSSASLFGQRFEEERPDGVVREFQTGRVRTHGAYLMVTDLFPAGRLSTMAHTVVMRFPREAPAGRALWKVSARPSGAFRLHGPAGVMLEFDGVSGSLRGAHGFSVAPPGPEGTPPRVASDGAFLRIEATGGNPFLRGRPVTFLGLDDTRCELSTSDLFLYEGSRLESDMFRFPTDAGFFRFVRSRCPRVELPMPAEPLMTAEAEPEPKAAPIGQGGLFGALFGSGRR